MSTLESWLLLVRVPGVGSQIGTRLLEHFATPENIFAASPSALRQFGLKDAAISFITQATSDAIADDLAWLAQPRNHAISQSDPRYPTQLKNIPSAPLVLFVHGDPEVLLAPQLGVVGSRSPTASGRENARAFSMSAASSGLVVTSGLAGGIDAAAHLGALEGGGLTIAVCGTGLDRVYPAKNRELAHQIAAEGALVSEFPVGTAANAGNFPRRNRIISGLSLGSLVVEAALKSGSLITARHASEQGREVFAIPGSIHNPLARGCHSLIRQGAKLVESAEDILEELAPYIPEARGRMTQAEASAPPTPQELGLSPQASELLEALGYEPIAPDTLIEQLQAQPQVVSALLLELELLGVISADQNGLYQRLR